jgi:membrane protease YdiL (CAAX protease family)
MIIYPGKVGGGGGLYAMGLMWSPGIAALITMKILKRDVVELGWRWGKTKYQVWSYLTPVIYVFITYLIIWTVGWGKFYNEEFVNGVAESFGLGTIGDGPSIAIFVVLTGTFGVIRVATYALGEEIGWRGFLVPELYKQLGFTRSSLIAGIIWGAWHLPVLIFADYSRGTPFWYTMSCFAVTIISASFIFTRFRMKSGSLWTGVILHASHNLFIKNIFEPLTADTGNTAYYGGEFGIVLSVISACLALYFWSRRSELKSTS